MKILKQIFQLIPRSHNWLSDKDFIWWPFSFLRPTPATMMTLKHTFKMTICFGGLTFFMFSGFALANNMFSLSGAFNTLIISHVGFFAWFNLITRPLWNYRARELLEKKHQ